jgi:alkylresorcinol/alkylpyrone synthase
MDDDTQVKQMRGLAVKDAPTPWLSPRISAVHGVVPVHRYEQDEVAEALALWLPLEPSARELLRQVHANSGVRSRHFALAMEEYPKLSGLGRSNDAYLEVALDLVVEAVTGALQAAGLAPADVDLVVGASTTGIATPSLDARAANRLGLRPDVRRLPLFGLGCVAGAAGLARVYDYMAARPDQIAVLFAVELCSLAFRPTDVSVPTLIGSALFGDGAAAVVLAGADRGARTGAAGPQILATRSHLYPDTEHLMGWDVRDTGFHVVLSSDIPAAIWRYLPGDVDEFLAGSGLTRDDIGRWVCHPGGPKVLRAIEESLQLPAGATELSWRSLESIGNVSSASVLHILRDHCRAQPDPGTYGLLMAVGPGFSCELVLLQW